MIKNLRRLNISALIHIDSLTIRGYAYMLVVCLWAKAPFRLRISKAEDRRTKEAL